jgi:LemA protein
MSTGWIVLGVIVIIVLFAFGAYNRLVALSQRVSQAFADIDVQLKQRHDLIPNLVETVKAFAQQEREVFQAVADARAKMAGAGTPAEKIAAANAESSALARLLVVVEAYPQLKSDATFARLMDELTGTENRLGTERMRYNERIQAYNTMLRRFPSNVTAKIFGFKEYPYFEAPADAKGAPKVDFKK